MQQSASQSPTIRGLAAASVGLGFFSLLVFWWFPFGFILSTVGLVLGLVSLGLRIRGGLHGENLAIVGTFLSATTFSVVLILTQGLRFVMWDH